MSAQEPTKAEISAIFDDKQYAEFFRAPAKGQLQVLEVWPGKFRTAVKRNAPDDILNQRAKDAYQFFEKWTTWPGVVAECDSNVSSARTVNELRREFLGILPTRSSSMTDTTSLSTGTSNVDTWSFGTG